MKINVNKAIMLIGWFGLSIGWFGLSISFLLYFLILLIFGYRGGVNIINFIGFFVSIISSCLSLTTIIYIKTNNIEKVDPTKEKEKEIKEKEKEIINELQKNPELFNKIMVELRKRKINKIKQSI
jgi:hypothetical protein